MYKVAAKNMKKLFCFVSLISILFPQLCLGTGIENLDRKPKTLVENNFDRQIAQLGDEDDIEVEEGKPPAFAEVIKNTQKIEGLFTLYRDNQKGKIYLEIKPEQLNKYYLATMTMESGIGERGIYSTTPLQDFVFYFRRVNNNLQFVVRNVRYRTRPEDPQRRSIERSFSDSVLASLRIRSIHPQRKTILIDLGDLLLKDLPDLSSILSYSLDSGYSLDRKKSYFGDAKVFPLNLEIDSVYGFSLFSDNNDYSYRPTLPDRRSLNIRVHYSLSELPTNNGYVPRLADERVGYFTTVYQNFSNQNSRSQLVRYINRWNLEKQDPNAPLSPPKKPIVFWIENTVPLEYREAIKEGILLWNKAFEKAGFKNAIEVQQMPDNATWNPADVRYNTIRWFASADTAFAAGPSRVNPFNGEILDADIIIDANMVSLQRQTYRTLVQQTQSNSNRNQNFCGPFRPRQSSHNREDDDYCYAKGISGQFAIGSLALSLFQNAVPNSNQVKDYVHQYLRHVISHEVGHTLGLRHNFRGSALLKPEELNNTEITRSKGMVSSVMDYVLVNLAPIGTKQGEYFPSLVGPYDEWAIEYGYKPSGMGTTQAEKQFLQQIAGKQNDNPELSYATDEDTEDLDPTAEQFDLSSDSLRYSQWQLDNARAMWERLQKSYPVSGEDLGELRENFDLVLVYYFGNLSSVTKYIGGQSFYRERGASANGRLPFEIVPVEKQREALAALQKYLFAADAFNFPPELLNRLAPSRWTDWEEVRERLDYPIHDRILSIQSIALRELLSGDRLERLKDIELKAPSGSALTIPELFNSLQDGIWTEILPSQNKELKISSLRRGLQREHLDILISMVLRTEAVPEDARSLAWQKLRQLRENIKNTLRKQGKNMDDYTKAHLEETSDRITKVLDAPLRSKRNK